MKKKRFRQILIAVGTVVVVLVVLGGIKAAQIQAMIKSGESFQPPPEAVTTADVVSEAWEASLTAVGSVVPVMGVTLTAEIPGTVRSLHFESGEEVKKGALIIRLDTSTERAELAAAKADAKLANAELERTKQLLDAKARSQADLDAAVARAAQAAAAVQNVQSVIAKKVLRAPFSGRLGIRSVDLGEFLPAGTPIVALESLDPIYVDFLLPQQALARVDAGQSVVITGDTFGDKRWEGVVQSVDVRVDPSTRNVRLRAIVDNPEGNLRPGMFVNVQVVLPTVSEFLIIPESAVLYAPYGDSVFVVREQPDKESATAKLTVEQVFVRLGERRGDMRAVTSGLNSGDTIVSTAAFKLHNNMAVMIDNSLSPRVSTEPSPENQ